MAAIRRGSAFVALMMMVWSPPAVAQRGLGRDEALRIAFPEPARIERRTAFLTEDQLARARELAGPGVDVDQSVVTYYVGVEDGKPLGVAYFDVHRVRTLPELLMVVITPGGRIERVEVLRFHEPPEYRPPAGWLKQFEGAGLTDALSLQAGVVRITGASLTSHAVTGAVRRVLALHRVIGPLKGGSP